jgi:hypothetical protein
MRVKSLALLLVFCTAGGVFAQDDHAGMEFYEKKIRPLLLDNCGKCHTGKKLRGNLSVDSRETLLEGGDNGAAIVPGQPGKSLLIKAVKWRGHCRPGKVGGDGGTGAEGGQGQQGQEGRHRY